MSLAQLGAAGLGEAVVSGQALCSPRWRTLRPWQPLPSPRIGAAWGCCPMPHGWLGPDCCPGGRKACPALSKDCLCMEVATTGLPSLSKKLQELLGSAVSLITPFHLVRRFPCRSIPSGMGSHCRCCSEEGEEHTHPSLPSTCSWMYRLCQCLWEAPQSWRSCCSHGETSAEGDRLQKRVL